MALIGNGIKFAFIERTRVVHRGLLWQESSWTSPMEGSHSMISPIILFACVGLMLYYVLDNASARHKGQASPV
jgi:hypothetical protein